MSARTSVSELIRNLTAEDEIETDSGDEASASDDCSSDSLSHASRSDTQSVCSHEAVHVEHYQSRNGTSWTSEPPPQRGRRPLHHIVRETDGPAPHVRPMCLEDSFGYFITDDISTLIVGYTNQEAQRQIDANEVGSQTEHRWTPVTADELRAFFGILLLMGVLKGGNQRLADFWDARFGQASVIATMSCGRFKQILRFLRFDDKATRSQRQQEDKLAPIREVWNTFLRNCRRNIIPSAYLCVDEQLLGTKGRCPIRIYMANKPNK